MIRESELQRRQKYSFGRSPMPKDFDGTQVRLETWDKILG